MQLPDEAVEFNFQGSVCPHLETWTPLAELQSQHLIRAEQIDGIKQQMMQVRQSIGSDRTMVNPPAKMLPQESGFIDLPSLMLDQYRRKGENSELGRILRAAGKLREETDRVVVLGIGGSFLGAKALFDALSHTHHNELPERMRHGKPRLYFEGNNVDNDSLQDLLDMLENTCVDPAIKEERWGVVVVSKSGGTLETASVYRIMRNELARFYGHSPESLRKRIVPVTGPSGKLRELCLADGFKEDEILKIPESVGGRFSVMTAAGLLPAAVVGLDILALLLGAATMTRRFLEEPFDRNPVLQYAAVNHLLNKETGKNTRVMAVWSRKLEALGMWHDQLLAESLGKQNLGPTPLTVVQTRDLHSRGQQHQDGPRNKVVNNLFVKGTRHAPIQLGMADRNEDDLNSLSRKTLPDILSAAFQGTNQAFADAARPTNDLILPTLSEHTMGQLMQMLMLATIVEGRLLGVNPYGQPGVEAYKKNMTRILKEMPSKGSSAMG